MHLYQHLKLSYKCSSVVCNKSLPTFLTWKIFVIFQVVVVGRIHSITPSLPVRHLDTRGSSYMKRRGMLVGKFEFNS